MSLRDWLILIGVLVVTGILVDGIHRMRKRNRISLKIDKQYENLPDVDLNAELPNGGARPARQHPGVNASEPVAAQAAAQHAAAARPDVSESLVATGADSDVDLLLDGDFKGVGQGADDYLSVSHPMARAKPQVTDADIPGQHAVSAQQTPAAANPAAAVDLLTDNKGRLGRPHASIPTSQQPPADCPAEDDVPTRSTARQHSPAADEPRAQSLHADVSAAPTLAPVAASDEDLDLSQPVTLLMEQMQQRETASRWTLGAAAEHEFTSETSDAARAEETGVEKARGGNDGSEPAVTEKVKAEKAGLANEVQAAIADTGAAQPAPAEGTPPDSKHKSEQPVACERIEPTLGAATDDLLLDDGLDAPLTTDARANNQAAFRPEFRADDPAVKEPEKPKTKKSALTRLREEIQISFFDDLELAEASPVPDEAAQTGNSNKSRKNAKKAGADKRSKEQNAETKQGRETRDSKPWEKKAGSFLSRRKKPDAIVEEHTVKSSTLTVDEEEPPLLVMHVAGRDPLFGPLLFKLVEACGMEFGDMQIYHRYEDGPGQGAVQFSMVNAYKPGVFDPVERDSFSTPGVNLFLDMSEPKDLMNAFECMLATAQCLCDNLNAVLKDEHLSVMRPQTIEHYRQQIIEFERRRLAKRA